MDESEDNGLEPYLLSKLSVGGRSAAISDDQEFQEAEVWDAVHDDDHHFRPRRKNMMMKKSKSSNSFASSSVIGAPLHHHGGQPQSSSDPLLTPVWSDRTAGLSHKSSSSMSGISNYSSDRQQNVEAEHEEDEMIPPHEWIARRLERSQISSSSVCEGAGRTLKGRDLSRVRNAVLAKTGFLEQ